MLSLIHPEQTLLVRSRALKFGLSPAECLLPTDFHAGVFHVGYTAADGIIAGVATFAPENLPDYVGSGYRLRQMGVLPEYRRQHIGEALVQYGEARIAKQGVEYLWFNARRIAYPFYESLGFAYISGEFELAGIGPHRQMLRKIV